MRVKLLKRGKFVGFEGTTNLPEAIQKSLMDGDTSKAFSYFEDLREAKFDSLELVNESHEKSLVTNFKLTDSENAELLLEAEFQDELKAEEAAAIEEKRKAFKKKRNKK